MLKLLQETYLNKVKMIYIDPPYNTGNDFVYEDDFTEDTELFLKRSNQKDEEGNRLVANTDSNGRFHSDWLSMMYPRLKLARNLLKDDGVIFISIDDNEVHNLRKICDEVYGEDNFVAEIVWKKSYGGGAKSKYVVKLHEYILLYAKSLQNIETIDLPPNPEVRKYYTGKDEKINTRGPYRTQPLATNSMDERPNLRYPIFFAGEEIWPEKQWQWSRQRVERALEDNELIISKTNEKWSVRYKQYLIDEDGNERAAKLFSFYDGPYTQKGTDEIKSFFGNGKFFTFPKPSELIFTFASMLWKDKNAIILDFFVGSASTAHAVMNLNAEDGGNRKFIMVQLPETCDENSEAFKAGYKTIAEIGKERIRRAGKKIKEQLTTGTTEHTEYTENKENKDSKVSTESTKKHGKEKEDLFNSSSMCSVVKELDIGFRVFKVDSSNMKDVYYTPDEVRQGQLALFTENIKEDRRPEDLLFQVFLDWGLELTLPVVKETIEGKIVFFVDDNVLAACFDTGITEELVKRLARRKPLRAVFRDSSYGSDNVKINVEQIFKLLSPVTEVRTI